MPEDETRERVVERVKVGSLLFTRLTSVEGEILTSVCLGNFSHNIFFVLIVEKRLRGLWEDAVFCTSQTTGFL